MVHDKFCFLQNFSIFKSEIHRMLLVADLIVSDHIQYMIKYRCTSFMWWNDVLHSKFVVDNPSGTFLGTIINSRERKFYLTTINPHFDSQLLNVVVANGTYYTTLLIAFLVLTWSRIHTKDSQRRKKKEKKNTSCKILWFWFSDILIMYYYPITHISASAGISNIGDFKIYDTTETDGLLQILIFFSMFNRWTTSNWIYDKCDDFNFSVLKSHILLSSGFTYLNWQFTSCMLTLTSSCV